MCVLEGDRDDGGEELLINRQLPAKAPPGNAGSCKQLVSSRGSTATTLLLQQQVIETFSFLVPRSSSHGFFFLPSLTVVCLAAIDALFRLAFPIDAPLVNDQKRKKRWRRRQQPFSFEENKGLNF